MSTKIIKDILIDFIDYINNNYDIVVIENYKYKFGYGDTCLAFECDQLKFTKAIVAFLINKEVLDYDYHRFNDSMVNLRLEKTKDGKLVLCNPEWSLE